MKIVTWEDHDRLSVEGTQKEAVELLQSIASQINPSSEDKVRVQVPIVNSSSDLRVMDVGLPKSGCHTIAEVFKAMGYRTIHARHPDEGTCRNYVATALLRAYGDDVDPMAYYPPWTQVVTHTTAPFPDTGWLQPWTPEVFDWFRKFYPDVWVILAYRPIEKQVASMFRWFKTEERRPDLVDMLVEAGHVDMTSLPSIEKQVGDYVEGYWNMVREYFKGDPKFFELDIEDGYNSLIKLQDMGFPAKRWPWGNKYWTKTHT